MKKSAVRNDTRTGDQQSRAQSRLSSMKKLKDTESRKASTKTSIDLPLTNCSGMVSSSGMSGKKEQTSEKSVLPTQSSNGRNKKIESNPKWQLGWAKHRAPNGKVFYALRWLSNEPGFTANRATNDQDEKLFSTTTTTAAQAAAAHYPLFNKHPRNRHEHEVPNSKDNISSLDVDGKTDENKIDRGKKEEKCFGKDEEDLDRTGALLSFPKKTGKVNPCFANDKVNMLNGTNGFRDSRNEVKRNGVHSKKVQRSPSGRTSTSPFRKKRRRLSEMEQRSYSKRLSTK